MNVRAAAEMPLTAGLQYETELFVTCFASDDKRERRRRLSRKAPGRVHRPLIVRGASIGLPYLTQREQGNRELR